jgi:predicted O-methyltransferase YrrM
MNFFTLRRNDENLKIIHKKDNLKVDMSIVRKCNKYEIKFKTADLDEDIKFIYLKAFLKNPFRINDIPHFYYLLKFNINEAYSITSLILENKPTLKKSMSLFNKRVKVNNLLKKKIKYKYVISNHILVENYNKIKNINYISREKLLFLHRLRIFKSLFDILEDKGTFWLSLLYFNGNETINLLYLLTYMFESVTIYSCEYVVCYNFLGKKSLISQNDIKNLILNSNFSITPKFNIKELLNYINDIFKKKLDLYELLYNNKTEMALNYYLSILYDDLKYGEIINNSINIRKEINTMLKNSSYFAKIKNRNIDTLRHYGKETIPFEHGTYIKKLGLKYNYNRCIELGMGNGGYSYYILVSNAPKHISLVSIDLYQDKTYKNAGINYLKTKDLDKYHNLIEKESIIALSELLVQNGKNSIDFIFINEMNNYENVLYDITLCDLLLDINGIIIILLTDKNKLKPQINYLKSTKKYDIIRSDKKLIVFHKKI